MSKYEARDVDCSNDEDDEWAEVPETGVYNAEEAAEWMAEESFNYSPSETRSPVSVDVRNVETGELFHFDVDIEYSADFTARPKETR